MIKIFLFILPLMHSRPYQLTWIFVLATLTALGPFSIDMYLSALPLMAKDLSVTSGQVASTLPAYFMGLAFGQLIYGPITDHFGRRRPLFFGLGLYLIASLLCIFATQLDVLLLARIAQALGGCVGVVVARSAIRDTLSGTDAAQAFSALMIVQGLAPILAPLFGSLILYFLHWRIIFLFLFILGGISFILAWFKLPETLPVEKRKKHTFVSATSTYIQLFKNRTFIIPSVASGILMGMMFTYINSASEVIMDQLHASTILFSILFGINSCGIIFASNLNRVLLKRYRPLQLLKLGSSLQLLGALILTAFIFSHALSTVTIMLGLFPIVAAVGFVGPNAAVLALAEQGHQAGQASALLGSLQFLFGLISGVLLSFIPFNIEVSVCIVMLIYSIIGVGLVHKIKHV